MPPVKLIVPWHEFLSKWEYQFVGAKHRERKRERPGGETRMLRRVARPGWKPEGGEEVEEEAEKEEAGG